jgi:hypothetical protein
MRPLRRPTYGWEDNIKVDLRDTRWESVDWMHLIQDRDHCRAVGNTITNL